MFKNDLCWSTWGRGARRFARAQRRRVGALSRYCIAGRNARCRRDVPSTSSSTEELQPAPILGAAPRSCDGPILPPPAFAAGPAAVRFRRFVKIMDGLVLHGATSHRLLAGLTQDSQLTWNALRRWRRRSCLLRPGVALPSCPAGCGAWAASPATNNLPPGETVPETRRHRHASHARSLHFEL